ncbi:redoxin domain-containing protein [Maribacter sp. 2304DJ31-5]|uniref:redoxin domain-containing protein n=1 Tax=Maribacter sp. 2304DJ31-5 TaxID=3386273 RepID=UPI0039BC4110
MKLKLFLLLGSLLLLLVMCKQKKETDSTAFEIEFQINGLEGTSTWFVEQPVANYGNLFVDTVTISQGKLLYKGNIPYPKLSKLVSFEKKGALVFMLGPGKHKITADYKNISKYGLGTKFEYAPSKYDDDYLLQSELEKFWSIPAQRTFADLQKQLKVKERAMFKEVYGVSQKEYYQWIRSKDKEDKKKARAVYSKVDPTAIKQLKEQNTQNKLKLYEFNKELIIQYLKKHPNSYVSLFYVLENIFLFGPPQTAEVLEEYVHLFGNELKGTKEYKAIFKKYQAEKNLKEGIAPDFELPTPEGERIKLSSLRGKVVLVDFWASWCVYCRKETPNLKQQYEKYKDHGLEILSVSFDTKREHWLKALEEDHMPWLQVADLRGVKKSEVTGDYGVNAIPFIFLLDREGKVVAKNIRQPSMVNDEAYSINFHLKNIFGF